MRGKRREPPRRRGLRRIIPARAGQTRTRSRRHGTDTDHPRACGANLGVAGFAALPAGSSPRVRGKRRHVAADFTAPRIIPARAGQTPSLCATASTRTDHPRACGANLSTVASIGVSPGSSPRVRGKHLLALGDRLVGRIIPARAGQTRRRRTPAWRRSDHPRACGANDTTISNDSAATGSSPRVRGKPGARFWQSVRHRIIPARAGQTSRMVRLSDWISDHPRACGANRLA